MKTSASKSPGKQVTATRPLQIILAYDQPLMVEPARTMLDRFLTKWASDVEVHRDEWSFAELEHPRFRSEAIELAKICDILVIAVTTVDDLSAPFFHWLNEWLHSRTTMDTAIILCAANISTLNNLHDCELLLALARGKGLSFFSTTISLPTGKSAFQLPQPPLPRFPGSGSLPEFSALND